MLNQTLGAQAQKAYDAAVNSPCPDWRAVAELFRAAMQAERVKRAAKPKSGELPDYNVDRVRFCADRRALPFGSLTEKRCSHMFRPLPVSR
jgi:hypothetical protein